jgi:hypothetical protein
MIFMSKDATSARGGDGGKILDLGDKDMSEGTLDATGGNGKAVFASPSSSEMENKEGVSSVRKVETLL